MEHARLTIFTATPSPKKMSVRLAKTKVEELKNSCHLLTWSLKLKLILLGAMELADYKNIKLTKPKKSKLPQKKLKEF